MLYLIGLGLNVKGYSKEAYDAVQKCQKVYLENYTVNFPYSKEELEKELEKEIENRGREKVEDLSLLKEAKKEDVALLIYGSPLAATTHTTLIDEAKKLKIKTKVIHGASVFDGVAETGLQMYKFGKTTSIPHFEADSFGEIIKENQSINAHTLVLIDIGLDLDKALDKIEKSSEKYKIKINKIILCSRLGNDNNSKIFYDNIKNLRSKKIEKPFCLIVPGKLHFSEEEFLEKL